jgi:hypothetical protein
MRKPGAILNKNDIKDLGCFIISLSHPVPPEGDPTPTLPLARGGGKFLPLMKGEARRG